jgi:hypothetical protein
VDFVKLNVGGAELEVLRRAEQLLTRQSRPTILVEVEDRRTRPWGYAAREIIEFLARAKYCWFRLNAQGGLEPLPMDLRIYDANLVALASERIAEFDGVRIHPEAIR